MVGDEIEGEERACVPGRKPRKPDPRAATIDEPSRNGAERPAASAKAATANPPVRYEPVERSTVSKRVSDNIPKLKVAAASAYRRRRAGFSRTSATYEAVMAEA